MAEILDDIEPGPDGEGHWPVKFMVSDSWTDGRTTAWRSVTNHPALQAKRVDDALYLRAVAEPSTVYTYQLSTLDDYPAYLAERTT